jgi:hypothetical protein
LRILGIADCGLRIADSAGAATRGVNGRDGDGDEFIGFLHEQFQFRGLHQPGPDQEFHPVNHFVRFFFDPVLIRNSQSAIRNPDSLKNCPI